MNKFINNTKTMNQKLKGLFLLLLVAVSAKAQQIEHGKVYYFENVAKPDKSMVITANDGITVAITDTDDYNQLWYVSRNSDNSYSLRNLGSGRYLRSSNATSARWTMVREIDDNCKLLCKSAGLGYSFIATNSPYANSIYELYGSHYMHYGENQDAVVCWSTDAEATQWKFREVGVDSDVLEANWKELESVDPSAEAIDTYQTALNNLFSDKSCTALKKSFASEAAVKDDADYKALSTTLQEMVLKVYNNNWTEANYNNAKPSWETSYAKKYRVQLYEPYNEPEAASQALGINAHTNLNNPTGVFANAREVIYVMVGGTIKEGASLYISSYSGNGKPGGYADGIELKEGLNVLPSFTEGNNYVINYVVHTFDTSNGKKGNAAKARKLSDYDDLKIHIEGGYINGYWNKMGDALYTPDTHENWNYIEARATQTTVTVLGEYITLQFPLREAIDNEGRTNNGLAYYLAQADINKVINEWDNIMMWERFLLGVLDEATTKDTEKNVISPYSGQLVIDYIGDDVYGYGDYYNVHGLSYGIPKSYMYGSWDHCGYHYNTMQSIIVNMLTDAGSHWGPGHEIGHQHQTLITMRGETEVSNNLFANMVLWYFGETTSRVNGSEGSLEHVLANFNLENGHYLTNNIWAMTHMYYKLFLYYHVLGHDSKFYPRLFEMLRQDPMSGKDDTVDGDRAQLHLYKKVCQAAGADLTEFFRAHGFFRPLDGFVMGDYGTSTYYMTQEQIDAAIAEVKAWGYDENLSVLFINDATGETIKSHKGDNLNLYNETTICAEVGSYASFKENTTSDYTYSMVGTTMMMMGEGGIGFAIFNEKNELMAFSNMKTFTISEECAAAIASGKAKVKAVNADNSTVEAIDVMDTDQTNNKYAALRLLLAEVSNLLQYVDDSNSKPGFYKASVLVTLQSVYENALLVYENKEVNSYKATFSVLSQEYTKVIALKTGKTPFLPGSTYVLTNKKYPTTAMTLSANGMMCVDVNNSSMSSARQWTFEATSEKDVYYLKNGSNYLGSLLKSTQVGVTAKETASRYKLYDLGKGLWALQCQNDSEELQSLHCEGNKYNIVGWSHTSAEDDGSWWYLTATYINESMLPLYDLQELIIKTEDLVDEVSADDKYKNFITVSEINEIRAYLESAQQKCNAGSVTTADVEAMQEQYNKVFLAYSNANNEEFNAAKEELETLISSVNSLINSCGTVTYIPGNYQEALDLQATDPTGYNYLSTNAPETLPDEAELLQISHLIDNDNSTYFHSAWSWAVGAAHHLKVDLGNGKSLKEFTFTYTTGKRPFPYEIKVYGSNNDVSYTHLATFSKNASGLPTTNEGTDDYRASWTSPTISSDVAYRYLRFDVTESGGKYSNPTPKGEYCFSMSNFGITAKRETESYTVELGDNVGNVTEELLLATYKAAQEAQAVGNSAIIKEQLQEAINELQDQYSELYLAKDNALKDMLSEWIVRIDELIALCGAVTPDGNGDYIATLFPATAGDVTEELLLEVYIASEQAKALLDDGTKTELEQATEALMALYETLDIERQSTVKSTLRAELRALINQTEELMDKCGTIVFGETEYYNPVALQTTQSDAAFYLSTNAQESSEGPIANLLQDADFFHSSWSKEIGAAHYLQVDMGDGYALDKFAFSYTTRDNGDYGPHPSVIVVSGSNDKDGSFVELATFDSGLPTEGNTTWNATNEHVITASQAYRYLRFTVTQSFGYNGSKHKESNEYYFAMSRFALFDVAYSANYYAESLNPYGSVTEEQLLEVFYMKNAAEELAESSVVKDALEAQIADLQELYDALLNAHNDNSYLPVALTTNMESPALYMLYSQRGDNKVLQYNPASGHMLDIVDVSDEANVKQLFYFTVGEKRGQVYMHPFVAGEQVLAANDISKGAEKVFVSDKQATEAMQWTFAEESIDNVVWYSLKVAEQPLYFSNYGGGSNKMGFFDSKDQGSRFVFTPVEMEGSSAYHSLRTYYDEAAKDVSSNNPGYYRSSQAYDEAYATASELFEGTSDYAAYLLAYHALRVANEALEELILPEEGKFYVIRSAHDGYAKDALMHTNSADNKMYWGKKETDAGIDATAIWSFVPTNDGAFQIYNYETGKSINDFSSPLSSTAGKIVIESLSPDGQVSFGNNGLMHAAFGGDIVVYPGGTNSASAWRIEDVTHTTGIDAIKIGGDAVIYDLYGRRVVKVVVSGLYIIDGEKRYIQVK